MMKKAFIGRPVDGANVAIVWSPDGCLEFDRREAREVRNFLNHFIEWDAQGEATP